MAATATDQKASAKESEAPPESKHNSKELRFQAQHEVANRHFLENRKSLVTDRITIWPLPLL